METIGSRIKALREAKSLSLRGLAKLVGCSQPHLSDIENGKKNPSHAMLDMIATALSIDARYLRYGEEADKIGIARLYEVVEKSGDREAFLALERLIDKFQDAYITEQRQRLKAKENVLKTYEFHAQKGEVPEAVKKALETIQYEYDEAERYMRALVGPHYENAQD